MGVRSFHWLHLILCVFSLLLDWSWGGTSFYTQKIHLNWIGASVAARDDARRCPDTQMERLKHFHCGVSNTFLISRGCSRTDGDLTQFSLICSWSEIKNENFSKRKNKKWKGGETHRFGIGAGDWGAVGGGVNSRKHKNHIYVVCGGAMADVCL